MERLGTQIASSNLLSSLAAQIATPAAQTAAAIGTTAATANDADGLAVPAAKSSPAATLNSASTSAFASNTLGVLIQQIQTDQDGGPAPLASGRSANGPYLGQASRLNLIEALRSE